MDGYFRGVQSSFLFRICMFKGFTLGKPGNLVSSLYIQCLRHYVIFFHLRFEIYLTTRICDLYNNYNSFIEGNFFLSEVSLYLLC